MTKDEVIECFELVLNKIKSSKKTIDAFNDSDIKKLIDEFLPNTDLKYLSEKESQKMTLNIGQNIIQRVEKYLKEYEGKYGELADLGSEIGNAVGKCIFENKTSKNIDSFMEDDFIRGFEHGITLEDGTH